MRRLLLLSALATVTGCVWLVDAQGYRFAEDGQGGENGAGNGAGGAGASGEGGAMSSCGGSAPSSLSFKTFPKSSGQLDRGVLALDAQGNAVAVGRIASSAIGTNDVTFQGAPTIDGSANLPGLFFVRFDRDYEATLARGYFADDEEPSLDFGGLTFASGKVPGFVLGGTFGSRLSLGETLESAGGRDSFIAKFSTTGEPLWATSFGDASNQSLVRVIADENGDVLLASRSDGGKFSFGPGCSAPIDGAAGIYVAKLRGEDGTCVWMKRHDTGPSDRPIGLGYDASRDVGFITGATEGFAYFGSQGGKHEVFVHAFDASDGRFVWPEAVRFGPAADESAATARWGEQVRVGACGDIFVVGAFEKDISFAGKTFENPHYQGGGDTQMFVAKLDPKDGSPAWVKTFPHHGTQAVHAIALGPGGEIAITGELTDAPGSKGIDFGGGLLSDGGGAEDGFLAVFVDTEKGPSYRFATRLQGDDVGNAWPQRGLDVAVRETGEVIVYGSLWDSVQFSKQAGAAIHQGQTIFLAEYAP